MVETADEAFPPGAAFILGGSGGLGRAICTAFARVGVPVALSYHKNPAAAEQTAEEVRAHGVEAAIFQLDASSPDAVVRTLADAAAQFDSLSTVVYAAGPQFTPSFFSSIPHESLSRWVSEDLLGCLNLAQAAIPHLRKSKGSFIALSTYQNNRIEVQGSISSISKAAIDRAIVAIAKEEGRYGVRANSVRAGWFEVDMNLQLFARMPGLQEEKHEAIPLRRLGKPEELASAVTFLASYRAGFITGVNLTVDGGESL